MTSTAGSDTSSRRREILTLAIPAFLTLVAEPLFLLADSAIIGHLGTTSLAGLGVATGILLTAVNIFVFLAYGTTSVVARRLGAQDKAGALGAGIDGIWLSLGLGILTMGVMIVGTRPLVRLFAASPAALDQAAIYLRISALGIPSMLLVLAATGVLRGLQDTRTPLIVATIGFTANAILSLLFVHAFSFGIAGAAWGTVVAQTGMALALAWVVLRGAKRQSASLAFHPAGVLRSALGGIPLLIRTLSLRAALVATTWVAADLGDAQLAAFQVSLTVWSALAFALDALAIAGQAITGKYLGATDVKGAREATSTMVRWGIWFGVILGLLLIAFHQVIPLGFTNDPAVHAALAAALIVVGLGQPIAGIAFVLDGVLIGAGDAKWLSIAQTVMLVAYLPLLAIGPLMGATGTTGLVILWCAFTAFMGMRAAGLTWRARGDAWLVTGATR
ncbi:MATE family efflux transporter [Ornithinimicrobium sp. INDO-MA30-4]|uniref:MATE family efflux transporter n=1 Tax=Ornithinimicrobium sp. INDO-MA30-4 TaxID=2908651 RepID=UPI001F2C1032|nr:MATE family efflux transporter [Ornithinimicrobium sp. INDO-MA30-4]UJH70117.1 MATE family efflux transporter [Ornithinimicrobium sp. INDO-MA30-4]